MLFLIFFLNVLKIISYFTHLLLFFMFCFPFLLWSSTQDINITIVRAQFSGITYICNTECVTMCNHHPYPFPKVFIIPK